MSQNKSIQLKVGAMLSYLQTAIGAIISLIYTPVMLSLLGQSEYGVYNIAATTVSYVNLLNMGFSSSYVRFYARDKAENDQKQLAKTNGLFLLVFLSIGFLALFAGFTLTAFSETIFADGLTASEYVIVKEIMLILTISTAYNLATSIFSSIVIAHEDFIFHRVVNLIKTVLNPSITWILLLMGYRSVMMAFVTATLTIVADTFYLLYCFVKLKIKIDIRHPSKSQLKEITLFSGFIALTSIVDQINWSIDKILLGRLKGTAETAVYSVAATIHTMYMQLSTSISNVFIPRVNRIVAEKGTCRELTDIFIRIGRMQAFVLLPILLGFVFLGKIFVSLWTPNGYSEVYIIAILLMGASIIPYIQNIGVSIQMAQNKHQFRAILYTIISIANLVLSIFLCKEYGAIGCAIGTAFSLIVGNVIIMNIYYQKKIKLDMIAFWKSMLKFLPTIIVLTVLGLTIMNFVSINTWGLFILFGCIFVTVYAVMLWLTVLTKSEKLRIASIFKK